MYFWTLSLFYVQTLIFPLSFNVKSRLRRAYKKLTLPKSNLFKVRTTLAVWADYGGCKSVHTVDLHCDA